MRHCSHSNKKLLSSWSYLLSVFQDSKHLHHRNFHTTSTRKSQTYFVGFPIVPTAKKVAKNFLILMTSAQEPMHLMLLLIEVGKVNLELFLQVYFFILHYCTHGWNFLLINLLLFLHHQKINSVYSFIITLWNLVKWRVLCRFSYSHNSTYFFQKLTRYFEIFKVN